MSDVGTATVRVTHDHGATAERVFDAWVDPAVARGWLFNAPGGQIVRADIDARVGGRFTIVDRREDGDAEHVGRYVEVERPRRLVFDFSVPKYSTLETRVTIDIVPAGTGCALTLTHDGVLADSLERTRQGWTTMLQRLDDHLAAR